MLLNNANPNPGQPMDNTVMLQMITKNHPNAFNVSGVLPQFQNSLLVREIWIGNISPSTEKNLIYEAFKIYGEIEGIEMFSSKGFAFTKYRKIVSATRAYEQAQGVLVDNRPVKVAFADPTRRYDIVGDSSVPEDPEFDPMDDDNFKNLFLGYSAGVSIPSERALREVFQRYGKIRSIYIKQATSAGGRPYAFVDFDKGE
jgi:RNA recognition motif-containing protein